VTPEKMLLEALAAKKQGAYGMTLVLPIGFKRPAGFPRGEFLSETGRGKVYSFDPDKIINWLNALPLPPN
jgi:hypothetical protein